MACALINKKDDDDLEDDYGMEDDGNGDSEEIRSDGADGAREDWNLNGGRGGPNSQPGSVGQAIGS